MPWLELLLIASWVVMLAWYPCCEASATTSCPQCSGTTPATISLTISGSANANCTNCAAMWDGTHVLTEGIVQCQWGKSDDGSTATSCTDPDFSFLVAASSDVWGSNNHGWTLTFTETAIVSSLGRWTVTKYEWDSGGDTAFDCTVTRSLSYDSQADVGGTGLACDLSGCTMSINPNG